jgi:hypothetical protein
MSTKRGMGTWYLRGNVWWIKYRKDGKPFRESSYSTKESDAKELLKSRLSEINQGTFTGLDYKKLTFDDLGQVYLADYQINQRRSYWRAKLSLDHLKGFFGGFKASAIDTPLIRQYIRRRRRTVRKTQPSTGNWRRLGVCFGWPRRTTGFRGSLTSGEQCQERLPGA